MVAANHDSVLIRVGKDLQEFYVPEKLLRANSTLFEKILEKDPKGQDRVVVLIETSSQPFDDAAFPSLFKIWSTFIYTGCLFFASDGDVEQFGKVTIGTKDEKLWRNIWNLSDMPVPRSWTGQALLRDEGYFPLSKQHLGSSNEGK